MKKIILKYMKENSKITIKKICEQTNLSKRTVLYVIKDLKNKNKIIRIGSDRFGCWHIIE
jgi:predicted HTH transcriptional regulator